ncbi:MAG: hypothetical protein KDD61_00245 [Bdellovibrionales bacterium]|nr:hypothetical protein [Bdellovibrionales bacterium]
MSADKLLGMVRELKNLILLLGLLTILSCKLDDNSIRGSIGGNSSITPNSPAISLSASYFSAVGGTVHIIPTKLEHVTTLSINPGLPTGLTLNTQTGEILGSTSGPIAKTDFTITASGPGGTSQSTFSLEIGYIFDVDTLDDTVPLANDISLGDGQCVDGNGNCSLRAAIYEAEALSPASIVINVPPGTYNLSQTIGMVTITNRITINGSSSASTTLDGGGAIRLFLAVIRGSLEFNHMEFKNAQSTDGAVFFQSGTSTIDGRLSFIDCLFENNRVTTSNDRGGAIYFIYPGKLNVIRSRFIGNYAYGSTNMDGGAILFDGNSLYVSESYFEDNYVQDGLHGAAIANRMTTGASDFLIENSTFKNNGTPSGSAYALTLSCNSTADNCIVKNSTFVGSNESQMAIYIDSSPLRLQNNTFSFYNASTILNASTNLLNNHELFGNIFENLGTGSTCSDPDSDFISLGYNIDSKNSCNFSATGDLTNTSPLLNVSGLALNGGITPTILLQNTSPAIDAIPAEFCSNSRDQRGYDRPYNYNGLNNSCDIGAVEMQ